MIGVERYPQSGDAAPAARRVTAYDARHAILVAQRRALEANNDDVSREALRRLRNVETAGDFPFEAILLATSDGIAGLAAAGIAVAIMDGLNATNEALKYLMNPVISWPIGFATVLILIAIGFLAGVFQARRAARLDPVESLRYE